jgi:hypothetical protein
MIKVNTNNISVNDFIKKYKLGHINNRFLETGDFASSRIVLDSESGNISFETYDITDQDDLDRLEEMEEIFFDMISNGDVIKEEK